MIYNFEDYWKNYGKLHNSVIKNGRELEDDFYQLAKSVWKEAANDADPYDEGHSDGWDDAEEYYKIKDEDKV